MQIYAKMINFFPTRVANASKYRPLAAKMNILTKRLTHVNLDQVLASQANIIIKLSINAVLIPSYAAKIRSIQMSKADAYQ